MGVKVKKYFEHHLISTLAMITDIDEEDKIFHFWRVGIIAYYLSKFLDLDRVKSKKIFYAGLLHDIGGIGLQNHVIHHATGQIDNQKEKEKMLKHPQLTVGIIKEFSFLKGIEEYILDHHERIDGSGYPKGKIGRSISLEAQIIGVADEFDLLLRETNNKTKIYNYFRKKKGIKFESSIWSAILEILNKDNSSFYYQLSQNNMLPLLMENIAKDLPESSNELEEKELIQIFGRVVAKLLDIKHPYTRGHTNRVAKYSSILAQKFGLPPKEMENIKLAAYLHDVGKLAIPTSILEKKEKLTTEELRLIKNHPINSMEIIDSIPQLRHLTEIAGYHHERYDGQGYPDKLIGEEIPIGARIIALVDAFDAITSNRSYDRARGLEQAIYEIKKYQGTQFDPQVVESFIDSSVEIEKVLIDFN